MPIEAMDKTTLQSAIRDNIKTESIIYTDDKGYMGFNDACYGHRAVNHSRGEYVNGNCHTSSIESVWAVLKGGVYGTCQHKAPAQISE